MIGIPLVMRLGSSPHVRGAQFGVHFVVLSFGIIPACAGSTLRK